MRTINGCRLLAACCVVTCSSPGWSQETFAGDWMLELRSEDAPIIGMLHLEMIDGNWTAYVEGGPVDAAIDGNSIEIRVDSRDLSGFVFYRRLTGTLDGDSMAGTFSIERERASTEREGTWTAGRKPAQQPRTDASRSICPASGPPPVASIFASTRWT